MMAGALQHADDASFAAHCRHIDAAVAMLERAEHSAALAELDAALAIAESPHARWNRAVTLLALGRTSEGLRDYAARFQLFNGSLTTPEFFQMAAALPRWRGEQLAGRRLVVIHEAGFGDAIMLLRYVGLLREAGIEVAMAMPPQLARLASEVAPIVTNRDLTEGDVGCFMFDLFEHLHGAPIPPPPYLAPDPALREKWRSRLEDEPRHTIGIAWSTTHTRHAAARQLPLADFLALLDAGDSALFSLQRHDKDEAEACGVEAFAFEDFADLAAFIAELDEVVTIDTAALHVAGAIGHPKVTAMLPYAQCWRWQSDAPWYPNIKLCRQQFIGDWSSAFACR